jgi:hypothetical protein
MPLSRSPVQSDAFCRSCYGVLEFWFSPPPMIPETRAVDFLLPCRHVSYLIIGTGGVTALHSRSRFCCSC